MPATQPSEDLHVLCHEHHLEMKLKRNCLNSEGAKTQAIAFGCIEPDCFVHYSTSRGYFMLNQSGNNDGIEMVPKIRCFLDGVPMYLAEINPEKRGFRLWRCPQCGASHTNEEDLIGLAPQEIQDLGEKNAGQSKHADMSHV
jgi:hypothetical protein